MLDSTLQRNMAAIATASEALASNFATIATQARDLTGRYGQLRERAMMARLARLDSIPAPAVVVCHDRILAANAAFTDLVGLAREYVEGEQWKNFILPSDHDRTGVAVGRVDRRHTGFRNTLMTSRGPVEVQWAIQGVGEGRFYGVATPVVGSGG